MEYQVVAFYRFSKLSAETLTALQAELKQFGTEQNLCGLVLLAAEGINGTVCGTAAAIDGWKILLVETFPGMTFNESEADRIVFKRWSVQLRHEIVNLNMPNATPAPETHVEPERWEELLKEDVVIIDTRNDYETELGMFENAVDPRLKTFTDFPKFVATAGIPKQKKILMYCTGGIRCEKAALEMKNQGYKQVYQLKGGILNYLKKFPNKNFKGECFVFDKRVSVDQDLQPSSLYSLCPHCGDPGKEEITCEHCRRKAVICSDCERIAIRHTCSKDCRYHYALQQEIQSEIPILSNKFAQVLSFILDILSI